MLWSAEKNLTKCIANLKESLHIHIESILEKLRPDLSVGNDEESVHMQILTGNIVQVANGIVRNGFEQIESNDIQELLIQLLDLTETDLEEMPLKRKPQLELRRRY